MTFSQTLKNQTTLNNLPIQRKQLLESVNLEYIKESLFDKYDVESIEIHEKFYSNEEPYLDKVPIVIEMTYKNFCNLVDSKFFDQSDPFEYFVNTGNGIYTLLEDNLWKNISSGVSHDQIL